MKSTGTKKPCSTTTSHKVQLPSQRMNTYEQYNPIHPRQASSGQ